MKKMLIQAVLFPVFAVFLLVHLMFFCVRGLDYAVEYALCWIHDQIG